MCDLSKRAVLKSGLLLAGGAALFGGGCAASLQAEDDSVKAFNQTPLNKLDETLLRRAIDVADRGTRAENGGNYPYGAVIRFADGSTQEAWNTVAKNGDPTRHAEMTLLSKLFNDGMDWKKDREKLRKATIYTNAEPCFMCAGAIFWSGIGRVVYGVSARQIDQIYKTYFPDTGHAQMPDSAMTALDAADIEVRGPYLIQESSALMHRVIGARVGHDDNPFKKQD